MNSQIAIGNGIAQASNGATAIVHYYEQAKFTPPLLRPPKVENFINRDKELSKLLKDLQPGRKITLCGPGGIGKSALASKVIWKLAPDNKPSNRFPAGIIWHDFYTEPRVNIALEKIAKLFGEEPKPTPAEAAQKALSGKQALILLDGAEDADDLPLILNLLDNCCALVTTRKKQDAGSERYDIQSLPTEESVSLFQAWSKNNNTDDTESVRKICELTGNVPLAVRLAGKYIYENGETISEFLEDLIKTPLNTLDLGNRKLESVPILLKRSLNQVSDNAINILGIAGLLAFSPFTKDVIQVAMPDIQIKKPLNELIGYGLLNREANKYFFVSHVLVHTYARKNHSPDNAILNKIADYYNNYSEKYSKQGHKGYTLLDKEKSHIIRVIEECKVREMWQCVNNLIGAVAEYKGYLDVCGYYTTRLYILQLGIEAAKNLEDKVRTLNNLGTAYYSLCQIEIAKKYFEQALIINKEDGNRYRESDILNNLGLVYWYLGQIEKAIDYHEQSLSICNEIGYYQGECSIFVNLGRIQRQLGQINKAINYYEKAATICKDQYDLSFILGNLGLAYSALGQLQKAINYHKQALMISRKIGHQRAECSHLGNIGIAYKDLGQIDKAIDYYEQALNISKEIGDEASESVWLGDLGIAHSNIGQIRKAIEYYEKALVISRKIGYRLNEGNQLGNLGLAFNNLGQIEKAINYFEKALSISKEVSHRQHEGGWLGNLGIAFNNLGQTKKAISYFEQAIAISKEISHRQTEGLWLGNIGMAYCNLGQFAEAIDYFKQAVVICREIQNPKNECLWLGSLANAYKDLGNFNQAIEYFKQALFINRIIGDKKTESSHLGSIGLVYFSLGEFENAIGYYEKAIVIFNEIGDRHNECGFLGNLAFVYNDLGQVEKAIEFFFKALAISREIGNRQGESSYLGNIGLSYYSLGDIENSIDYYNQAITISREIGDQKGEAHWVGILGVSYNSGKIDKAIECYEQALSINREIGDRQNEGFWLGNLAIAYKDLGDIDKAKQYRKTSLNILYQIKSPYAVEFQRRLNNL